MGCVRYYSGPDVLMLVLWIDRYDPNLSDVGHSILLGALVAVIHCLPFQYCQQLGGAVMTEAWRQARPFRSGFGSYC